MAEGRGALRELVAYLGFDLDEGKLDRAEKGVDRLKERSELLTKSLEAVGIALGAREIVEFVHSQIEMGDQLAHTSEMLGVSTGELQRFQYAANIADVSAEGASTALGFLNKAVGHAGEGNAEAAATFAKLHVQLKNTDGSARPLSQVIGDVADGLAALPNHGAKTVAAMNLFGRSGRELIPLLNKGRAGVEELYGEFDKLGGGLSDEFIHAAEEADHETKKLKFTMKSLSSEIGAALLPTVSELAEGAAHGLVEFREWTKGTHFLRNALITLGVIAGILVVTWGIMNIEILLVVAALALLALAVDDVITFFEGGDSLLGRFLDKLYGLGASKDIAKQLRDAWKEVSDAFGKLWDAAKELGPTLKDVFDTFSGKGANDVGKAKTGIQSMADAAANLATELASALKHINALVAKFDQFAKDHPTLVHAVQRQAHSVLTDHDPSIFGVIGNLGADLKEGFTGDASDVERFNAVKPTGQFQIPSSTAPGSIELMAPVGPIQQHNETHVKFYGLSSTEQAALKLANVVNDTQTNAAGDAFSAVGGGGPP